MFYDYIRTVGCNRFSFNGHKTITIEPRAKIQMILGTNGSGKSSLASIGFSPFPPDKNDFPEGGSWENKMFHNGRRYELSAKYADKVSYSFICDGEQLNPGGTVTIYNELVKEHFAYTRELHSMLTGGLNFTEMGPQQRRDWIAKLSTVDFGYAFKQYARFKKALTAAIVKRDFLQSRLNEETPKLLNPDDIKQMKEKVEELHRTLDSLMREPRCQTPREQEGVLENSFSSTLHMLDRFGSMEFPFYPKQGDLDLDELIAELNDRSSSIKGEMNVWGQRLSDVQQKLGKLSALMEKDPSQLEARRIELTDEYNALPPKRIDVPDELLINASSVISQLKAAAGELPSKLFSHQDLMKIGNEAIEKRQKADKALSLLTNITNEIDHIKMCQQVECPNCSTKFKPGIEPGKLEQLTERAVKGTDYLCKVGGEASEAEDWLERVRTSVQALDALETLLRRNMNEARGLMMLIESKGGLLALGREILSVIPVYENEVIRHEKRLAVLKQLDTVNQAIEQYARESGDYGPLNDEYKICQSKYDELHVEHSQIKQRIDELTGKLEYRKRWESYYVEAESRYEALRRDLVAHASHAGDDYLEEQIRKTRSTLAVNEMALSENEVVETLVKDLSKQLELAKAEEEAARRLVNEMCPKTGLIAETIRAQLGAIVSSINQLIKRIWGYSLYIELPSSEDTDLDYKFPMMVNGVARKDISDGSKSIKAVINRAFSMMPYYCMDLHDYPLFMDEPSEGFDEVHSNNLIPLLKDLVDSGRFSQLILISHDADTQVAFPNSETIILNDLNIRYPHPYNQHVEFS